MSRGVSESPHLIRAFANRRRELVQTMSQLRSSRMLRSRDLETSILSLWRFRHRRRSFFIENASEGQRTIKLNGASWFGGASLSQAGENVCQSGLCRRAEATKRASSGKLHLLNRASRARRGSRSSLKMLYNSSSRQECHGGCRRAHT